MPSDEPSRPYNWRPKSLAKLEYSTYACHIQMFYRMIYLIFYANTKVLVSKLMILNQVSIKKRHKLTYFSKFKNI